MNIQKLIFNLNDIYYTDVEMIGTCMIKWALIKHIAEVLEVSLEQSLLIWPTNGQGQS